MASVSLLVMHRFQAGVEPKHCVDKDICLCINGCNWMIILGIDLQPIGRECTWASTDVRLFIIQTENVQRTQYHGYMYTICHEFLDYHYTAPPPPHTHTLVALSDKHMPHGKHYNGQKEKFHS